MSISVAITGSAGAVSTTVSPGGAPSYPDAPSDGSTYARKDGEWVNITAASGRKVIYVSKGDAATDSREGLSKYDQNVPFATLQAAATASASGDAILLEPGTHAVTGQRVTIPQGVSLIGIAGAVVTGAGGGSGWGVSGLVRVIGNTQLRNISFIATSDNSGASVIVSGDVNGDLGGEVVLSDLKIRGGIDGFILSHLAGSVFIQNCDVTTRWDCVITSAVATSAAKTSISNSRFESLALTTLLSRCIYVPGGEVQIDSSFLISRESPVNQPNRTLMVSNEDGGSPSVFLTNCSVTADDTKSTTSAVFVESGGIVSLERSKLISTASSGKSVDANAAVNVAILSVFSNKAVGDNVTQLVGTITVSADVS